MNTDHSKCKDIDTGHMQYEELNKGYASTEMHHAGHKVQMGQKTNTNNGLQEIHLDEFI